MLRIAAFMTGDNFVMLQKDTPASRRKVIGIAIAMLVPILVWFISGYLLSSKVMKMGEISSLLTAICCSTLVFLMEKMIVMSKGSRWLVFFRILIGFILAMLGSLSIDEVVFHDDIENSISRLKIQHALNATDFAKIEFEKLNGYNDLKEKINESEDRYELAESDVINEANGTYGTGKPGVGKITALKDRKAHSRKKDLEKLYTTLAALDSSKAIYVENARIVASNNFSENGLLTRIKALAELIKSDGWMMFAYILFTLLMMVVEFLVVIFKSNWKMTNYERRMEMIEKIGERRMNLLMQERSPYLDPNFRNDDIQNIRRFLHKPVSLT